MGTRVTLMWQKYGITTVTVNVDCRQCTCRQQWRAGRLVADIGEGPDGGRRGLGAQAVTQSHHEVLVHGPQARIACMATKVYRIIRLLLNLVSHRAANYPSVFTITEKAPTICRVFSWLKVPIRAFTFKTLLIYYA